MSEVDPTLSSPARRLAGAVLDGAIVSLTLGIGWMVWYLIVARGGRSPAKQLLGMRVIREDRAAAGLGRMLIRDFVVQVIAFGLIVGAVVAVLGDYAGVAFSYLLFAVAALWCVWDAKRQCLWDKVVRTRVVYGRA